MISDWGLGIRRAAVAVTAAVILSCAGRLPADQDGPWRGFDEATAGAVAIVEGDSG